MDKHILLENEHIPYTLKRSPWARRVRLSVHRDGSIVVTLPSGAPQALAEQFVQEKSSWIWKKIQHFRQYGGISTLPHSKEDYVKHKNEALVLVESRVEYFNQAYGFTYNKISVKDQKTRWGSCSKKGNLNFSYRILFLEPEIQDLVIVHELCHLKEFNHSEKFWNLVASMIPNYKAIRKELKKKGLQMG
ncbi:MAG: M48 family metallopeptidase [Patescibacteria group bacterium]|nr:M48 family metallopeptidase [Patescibacteria group bacterium]